MKQFSQLGQRLTSRPNSRDVISVTGKT